MAIPAIAEVSPTSPVASSSAESRQSLALGERPAGELTDRDGYGVTRQFAATLSAYSRTADTFTNNPASPIQWPFRQGVPISGGFGPRPAPCAGCATFHDGIDMTPGLGTPIQAIADGVVSKTSAVSNGPLGVYAVIDHVIDGQKVSSLYAHMLPGSLALKVGEQVKVTDLVGLVGNTGQSTGAHLHLGILLNGTDAIDPYAWLKQKVRL